MQAKPGRTLMIVDQLTFYREGLRRLLFEFGFQAIWSDDNLPTDLPAALSNQTPDLLLIGTDVATAKQQITTAKNAYPSCRVVLLLEGDSAPALEAALDCGADSIVRKDSSCEILLETVRLVFDGVNVMPSGVFDALRTAHHSPAPPIPQDTSNGSIGGSGGAPDPSTMASGAVAGAARPAPDLTPTASPPRSHGLSSREMNVLHGLMEGLPNKQIARQLEITEATVKVHVKSILRKVGVRNRTQVAMWASHRAPAIAPVQTVSLRDMPVPGFQPAAVAVPTALHS